MRIACILVDHLPVKVERHRKPELNSHPLVIGGRPWDPGADGAQAQAFSDRVIRVDNLLRDRKQLRGAVAEIV